MPQDAGEAVCACAAWDWLGMVSERIVFLQVNRYSAVWKHDPRSCTRPSAISSYCTLRDVHGSKRSASRSGLVCGVSLAICENGIVQEIYRAICGEGVYELIRELIDSDIVVDVISGTSAVA
jgi:hypothetical protein